jgi:ligand-binding SRPBCC domain-containing protein
MAERTIERASRLRAPAGTVWAHATALPSINVEMGPWLHMTSPREARGRDLTDPGLRLGEPLFVSWVLFRRVLPVERMLLTIRELGPGYRLLEQSPMLFMRLWRHERRVEPSGEGCVVSDRVTLEPRLPLAGALVAAIVSAFFAHRHRQLARIFGAAPGSQC